MCATCRRVAGTSLPGNLQNLEDVLFSRFIAMRDASHLVPGEDSNCDGERWRPAQWTTLGMRQGAAGCDKCGRAGGLWHRELQPEDDELAAPSTRTPTMERDVPPRKKVAIIPIG
jgi:hypothetical protein